LKPVSWKPSIEHESESEVKKTWQGNRENTRVKEVLRSLNALDSEIEKRVFPEERLDSLKEQFHQERDT
jgi:hypothetical protein